jgi:excisionase family DNA binding protein
MKYSVKKASEILGVSISTLRRWEEERLIPERTPGGHRRYDSTKLTRFINKKDNNRITIAYIRVSSNDQKEDLRR